VFIKLQDKEIVSGFSKQNNVFFYLDDMFRSINHHQAIFTNLEQGTCSANTIHVI